MITSIRKLLLLSSLTILYSILLTPSCIVDADNVICSKPLKIVKIFMVHSYNPLHICTSPQREGIVDVLYKIEQESINSTDYKYRYKFIIHGFYMKTKLRYNTPSQIKYRAKVAIKHIKKFNPDIIITTDDNAFEFVGIPLSKKYYVVATGINKPFISYLSEYRNVISIRNIGVVEELFDLKLFFESLERAHIIFNNIYLIVNDIKKMQPTTAYVYKNYIEVFRNSIYSDKIVTIEAGNTLELESVLRELNNKPTSLLALPIQSLYDPISDRYIDKIGIIKILVKYNKKHMDIGGNNMFCKYGMMICNSPDFYTMGKIAGNIVKHILLDDKWFGEVRRPPTILTVNVDRLNELDFGYYLTYNLDIISKTYTKK